jgi:hypothetical protein
MAYWKINLSKVTLNALKKLDELDKTFIGTPDYFGMAYFWDLEYKHYLRDINMQTRVRIHNELLKAGLSVEEVSDKHKEIIVKYAVKDSHYKKCFGVQQ